jgi:molybdopterin/thiamine biosynthesis adenylyltransferase
MDIPDFGNKAAVVGRDLLEHNRSPQLVVRWRSEYVTAANVGDIIQENDCVLLACDNHKTRSIVGRHCASGALQNVVLISGGNDGVEGGLRGTYGNVQVYVREKGKELTASLDRFHPEIANPADQSPSELSCLERQVAGSPQLAVVNMAVACAMNNALLRLMMPVQNQRMYDEVALDVLDAASQPHWLSGPEEAPRRHGKRSSRASTRRPKKPK